MGYNYYSYQPSIMAGGNIAAIIMLLALAGAILVNFLFLSKKNEKKFDGFLGWLYDVLSFKKLMVTISFWIWDCLYVSGKSSYSPAGYGSFDCSYTANV